MPRRKCRKSDVVCNYYVEMNASRVQTCSLLSQTIAQQIDMRKDTRLTRVKQQKHKNKQVKNSERSLKNGSYSIF